MENTTHGFMIQRTQPERLVEMTANMASRRHRQVAPPFTAAEPVRRNGTLSLSLVPGGFPPLVTHDRTGAFVGQDQRRPFPL